MMSQERRLYIFETCSLTRNQRRSTVDKNHQIYKNKNASIVWNPSLKSEIDKLEDVQKFALWVCFKSWDSSYDDLLVKSRLLPLESRRLQFSLCHLFKILRGLTDFEDAPLQMKVNSYNTRPSSKPMPSLPQVRTNYYQHSFFPNIIMIWSTLPGEATNCNSILSFKKNMLFPF